MKKIFFLFMIMILLISCNKNCKEETMNKPEIKKQSLVIFWTSGDPEVFNKVVFPYGLNSVKNNWWDDVELLIWGPSVKTLSDNPELQEKITELKNTGLILTSCLWCADEYHATEILKKLDVDVKYMGKPLTDYLQSDRKIITF